MGGSKQITECCSLITQNASAAVVQNQDVSQSNISQQDVAIAVAVGEGSVARAYQIAMQTNQNTQSGSASSKNNSFVASCCPPTVLTETGDTAASQQNAEASVFPNQDVEQLNINEQATSVAISIDGGDAMAVQMSFQTNNSSQTGFAEAGNNTNCPVAVIDDGEKRNKKEEKGNPKKENMVYAAQADAKSGKNEKAVISLDHGGQKINIQIRQNGDVFINNQFIMNLK